MSVVLIGRYFDGQGSRCHDVEVRVHAGGVAIQSAAVNRDYPAGKFSASECSASRPRILQFDDGSRCELPATPALDEALGRLGLGDGWAARLPRRRRVLLAATVLLIGGLVSATIWGIPAAASLAAKWTPPTVLQTLDRETLAVLDARLFKASELPVARQQAFRSALLRLIEAGGAGELPRDTVTLHFRSSPALGANAMALSGGSIVLLDELVDLASEEGVVAVLAHELGHVHGRHGLDISYRSAAVAGLAAWLYGDISALVAVVPTVLLQAHYSREMEREADRFALNRLAQAGEDPAALPAVLGQLYRSRDQAQVTGSTYLDSHPAPQERLSELRAQLEQLPVRSR